MYVTLLSTVLQHLEAPRTTAGELLALTLERRARLGRSAGRRIDSAEASLVCDLEYDSALIRLCSALGLATDAARFRTPLQERSRLEHALAAMGVDLAHIAHGDRHDPQLA